MHERVNMHKQEAVIKQGYKNGIRQRSHSGTLQNLQFDMQDFASLADIAKLSRTLVSVLPSLRDISLPQILGPHENM